MDGMLLNLNSLLQNMHQFRAPGFGGMGPTGPTPMQPPFSYSQPNQPFMPPEGGGHPPWLPIGPEPRQPLGGPPGMMPPGRWPAQPQPPWQGMPGQPPQHLPFGGPNPQPPMLPVGPSHR